MKKKWLSLFIFCVMCLLCFNVKASAQSRSQLVNGKTTYYIPENDYHKVCKKVSGKSKTMIKLSSKESAFDLICVYKNDLYFAVDGYTANGGDYVRIVKYGLKTKKMTTVKKVKSDYARIEYAKGVIYINFNSEKLRKTIYTYNCKTKKYAKFKSVKDEIDNLLGIYDNYLYYYTVVIESKDGADYEHTYIKKCGIKNKKISTVKKFDGIVSPCYNNGSIGICHGYLETCYLGQKFSIYNCKNKSYKVIEKNATQPEIIDGKWYYVNRDSKGNMYVMRCDANGKNKKKLKKLPSNFMYYHKITKHSIFYADYEESSHTIKY